MLSYRKSRRESSAPASIYQWIQERDSLECDDSYDLRYVQTFVAAIARSPSASAADRP